MQKPNKLNLGCGNSPKPGYINVDIQADLNPDMIMDIRYLKDVTDNSIQEINADHVIEHFPYAQTYSILTLWYSKLEPGGTLKMSFPDLQTICKDIANGINVEDRIRDIYGGQDHPWNYHCAGFTPIIITKILKSIGFKNIVCEAKLVSKYPNLMIEAMK